MPELDDIAEKEPKNVQFEEGNETNSETGTEEEYSDDHEEVESLEDVEESVKYTDAELVKKANDNYHKEKSLPPVRFFHCPVPCTHQVSFYFFNKNIKVFLSRIINGYRNQNDIFHTLSHIVKGDGNHIIYHGRPISIPCIKHRIMYMERYRHDFPLFRLLFMVKHQRFPWGTEKSKLWNDVECTRITDLILQ